MFHFLRYKLVFHFGMSRFLIFITPEFLSVLHFTLCLTMRISQINSGIRSCSIWHSFQFDQCASSPCVALPMSMSTLIRHYKRAGCSWPFILHEQDFCSGQSSTDVPSCSCTFGKTPKKKNLDAAVHTIAWRMLFCTVGICFGTLTPVFERGKGNKQMEVNAVPNCTYAIHTKFRNGEVLMYQFNFVN